MCGYGSRDQSDSEPITVGRVHPARARTSTAKHPGSDKRHWHAPIYRCTKRSTQTGRIQVSGTGTWRVTTTSGHNTITAARTREFHQGAASTRANPSRFVPFCKVCLPVWVSYVNQKKEERYHWKLTASERAARSSQHHTYALVARLGTGA